jgi:hypothetical protein
LLEKLVLRHHLEDPGELILLYLDG